MQPVENGRDLHYFESTDRETCVMEYIFSKAAQAAILKMYSITDAYLLIRGMVSRTALLKNTYGGVNYS